MPPGESDTGAVNMQLLGLAALHAGGAGGSGEEAAASPAASTTARAIGPPEDITVPGRKTVSFEPD